uniref:DUF155 domain-containing protein n=1 Tax=Chromera velia CCMP2878 TaxID=1169474 RepID=A0A0G4HSE0_9ALVE|eukprot:Cvel_8272.t1-p1 / transcript=Cvel_8272.t1 / gene=Cvel_8272 / organism=Chromera_velia_CCMP2878 / gene_product=Sporulation protein RMD1, putative / transcript_product=Sporulation protein RMD1, putative / location=Cvel_scaffold453:47665-55102(-) / protein_length=357 / sequence_SO=supercontig / SO=protein_coding / is_pseudo=false
MKETGDGQYRLLAGQESAPHSRVISRKPILGRGAKKQTAADGLRGLRDEKEASEQKINAICVTPFLNLNDLADVIRRKGINNMKAPHRYDVIQVGFQGESETKVFFFGFGAAVCWNLLPKDRTTVRLLMQANIVKGEFCVPEHDPLLKGKKGKQQTDETSFEEDDMTFQEPPQSERTEKEEGEKASIKKDVIYLTSTKDDEKLAFSYAFAQSTKMTVFEGIVDVTIEKARSIPESMAALGKVQLSRTEISKQIGELFQHRFYVNLHSDILDTPEIFWDNDEFVGHYKLLRIYLEIPKRVEILNQRLDIVKDLYEMLNDELAVQHGYKLEWIVIYLILLEVFIEVFWNIIIKDVFHWV